MWVSYLLAHAERAASANVRFPKVSIILAYGFGYDKKRKDPVPLKIKGA